MQPSRDEQTAGWLSYAPDVFSLEGDEDGTGGESSFRSPTFSSGSPPDDALHFQFIQEIRELKKTNANIVQELFTQRSVAEKATRAAAEAKRAADEAAQRAAEVEQRYQQVLRGSEAMRQTAVALQTSCPEAAKLWHAQNDELISKGAALIRVQKVNERHRKKIRALNQKLIRKVSAETREVSRDYTKISRQKLANLGESGLKTFLSLETIASNLSTESKQSKQWSMSKFACDHVLVKIPGPSISRQGEDGSFIGGIASNPKRVIAMMMAWAQTNSSLRALAQLSSNEMACAQEDVYVDAERHRGNEVTKRKAFPGSEEKPLDVMGSYCEATLADSVHAFQNGIDRLVAKQIKTADGIHLALDISTFSMCHMQSIYIAAYRVSYQEVDAANHPVWCIKRIEGYGPAVAVGDKLTRQLVDENGNTFGTATARAAATSLALADLLEIVQCGCVSLGVDGGSEGGGNDDPSSKGNRRANKNGLGSYRRELFGTRAAFQQAMEKDGPFLNNVMELNCVTEDVRQLIQQREQPKTLDPVTSFTTCEKVFYSRDGKHETLSSRQSMTDDPLACTAMVKGGVPLVFSCLKHLGHNAALHSNKLTMGHTRDSASVILALNNVWIFARLRRAVSNIFGLPGCGSVTPLQAAVGARLKEAYPELFKSVQSRYKSESNFSQLTEACGTRWGAIGEGSVQSDARWPELTVGMILTFSSGLDESRANAAVSAWSKDGFCHGGMIQFSAKIGRVVFRLNDPAYILGTAIQSFFHTMVHGVLLRKSSHHKECSSLAMGGVDSVPRRILFFLCRCMWLIVPFPKRPAAIRAMKVIETLKAVPGVLYKGKGRKNELPWAMHYMLQYKGVVKARPNFGQLMLNPMVFRKTKSGRDSPVQHLYGDAYLPVMEGALDRLIEVIVRASLMKSDANRNYLPKGHIRAMCIGPQDVPRQRRARMVEAVACIACNTAKSVGEQYKHVLTDTHMFLAGMSNVDGVIVQSRGESGDMVTSKYYVATDVALANAVCFQTQIKEIEKGYASQLEAGEALSDFLHGPLKQFCSNQTDQMELDAFRRADGVRLNSKWTEKPGYKRGADRKIQNTR